MKVSQMPRAGLRGSALAAAAVLAASCAAGRGTPGAPGGEVLLLEDRFDRLRPGMFSSVLGPHTEYHYLREAAPVEGWAVSTFWGEPSQRGWWVVREGGRAAMAQTFENRDRHWHPMLVAGDPAWGDYRASVSVQADTDRRVGLAFHYQSDRVHLFFGVEGGATVLERVEHEQAFHEPRQILLGRADRRPPRGAPFTLTVTVTGARIEARAGDVALTATDDRLPLGRIALVASGPARFQAVAVTATRAAAAGFEQRRAQRAAEERALAGRNPGMTVWKRLRTQGFGVGRNLRFGDLDGDGRTDLLVGQVRHHGPSDSNAELSCLSALTFDGRLLWRIGEPDPYNHHLTNDVAFQIHDLDGDGKNEVLYTMGQRLIVAAGATGETLRSTETPQNPLTTGRFAKFRRILGDSLYLADLRGRGRRQDVVLKDRYQHVWVLDESLAPRWQGTCSTGHYPFSFDVDGDGKQELQVGHCLFDGEGKRLWSWEQRLRDHADGVAWVRLEGPAAPPALVMVASDEGFLLGGPDGSIRVHHRIGHAQSASVANYRDDLPGLEIVTANFWGSQGIVHLFDARGRLLHGFEPSQTGSPVLPVNWSGGSEELFVHTADVDEGGLFDGRGRRAVRFPADGHPDQAFAVLDLTGDARDEIVVWDPHELWVYTQDRPAAGAVGRRTRNPDANESNYRVVVSEPAAR